MAEDEDRRGEGGDESALPGERVEAEDARVLVAGGKVDVLDIRDDDAWGEAHIAGATHRAEASRDQIAGELDRDRPLIVVCDDGERSATLAEELREEGFQAASLEGGAKAWSDEKFPTEPSPDPQKTEPEKPKVPGVG